MLPSDESQAPQWGLSPLDRSAHAVDVDADHPLGAYIARCGHHLMIITTLHDQPTPGWRTCPDCARWAAR
jgi:hypothetical protein